MHTGEIAEGVNDALLVACTLGGFRSLTKIVQRDIVLAGEHRHLTQRLCCIAGRHAMTVFLRPAKLIFGHLPRPIIIADTDVQVAE